MGTSGNRWVLFIQKFHSPRAMSALVVIALVLSIPFTLSLVQRIEDLRQHADSGVASAPTTQSTNAIDYPWNTTKSPKRVIPVVSTSVKKLLVTIPFAFKKCPRKYSGDADCNNVVDQGDLSYWQIDYTSKTAKFADFNRDGKVTLADYNIWRQHAGISPTPVVQKVAENLGLGKLLSFIPWNKLSMDSFHVLAADSGSTTVTDSSVSSANGNATVTNTYADNSYSVQTVSSTTNDANATYYTSTGDLLAQINNFLQNASTTVQDGNTSISITKDSSGATVQTIKDSNGGLISSQVWTDQTLYNVNQPPQSATIATDDGYATLSLQPNNSSILTVRNTDGEIVSTAQMGVNGLTTNENSQTHIATVSDTNTGVTVSSQQTASGRISLFLYKKALFGVLKIANDGTRVIAFAMSGGNWKVTTYSKEGQASETVLNPLTQTDTNLPELSSILQGVKDFQPNRSYSNAGFVGAFENSVGTLAQTTAADQIVSTSTAAVLGARTMKGTKAVLGEKINLLALVSGNGTTGNGTTGNGTTGNGTTGNGTTGNGTTGSAAAHQSQQQAAAAAAQARDSGIPGLQAVATAYDTLADAEGRLESAQKADEAAGRSTPSQETLSKSADVAKAAADVDRSMASGLRDVDDTASADKLDAAAKSLDALAEAYGRGDRVEINNARDAALRADTTATTGLTAAIAQENITAAGGVATTQQAQAIGTAAGAQAVSALGTSASNTSLAGTAAGLATYYAERALGVDQNQARADAFQANIHAASQNSSANQLDKNAAFETFTRFLDKGETMEQSTALSWGEVSGIISAAGGSTNTVEGANAAVSVAQASVEIQQGQYNTAAANLAEANTNLAAAVDAFNNGTGSIDAVNAAANAQTAAARAENRAEDQLDAANQTLNQAQANLASVESGGGGSNASSGSVGATTSTTAAGPADGGGGGGGPQLDVTVDTSNNGNNDSNQSNSPSGSLD